MLSSNSTANNGFTLLESLMVVTILSVLVGYGIPAYNTFVKKQAVINETNDLLGDLSFARVSAIKLGQDIMIEPTSNSEWSDGWRVFVDYNHDNKFEEDKDHLLRVKNRTPSGIRLRGPSRINFNSLGAVSRTSTEKRLTVVHSDSEYAKAIDISMSGLAVARNDI